MLKTKKSCVLAMAVLLGSAATFAIVGSVRAANDDTNFYVGAQLGHSTVDYDLNYPAGGSSIDGDGVEGGLVLGISRRIKSFRIGAELEANLSSVETVIEEGGVTDKTELSHTYGVSLLGGISLTQSTMLYARVGGVKSEFKSAKGQKESKGGVRGGVGLQTDLTEKISMRGEYVHTNYSSINDGIGSVDPSTNIFRMALIYNF